MSETREETITLGGGCFWCLEAVYELVDGVTAVESGYCNGHVVAPTYEQVCEGTTGHAEVVQLRCDPARISLRELLEIFFTIHDPTTLNRQGNDVGTQYRSAIFPHSPEQETQARAAIGRAQADQAKPIVTTIEPLTEWYPAEGYHQDYYKKNPIRYKYYRNGCGREARLQQLWGSLPVPPGVPCMSCHSSSRLLASSGGRASPRPRPNSCSTGCRMSANR